MQKHSRDDRPPIGSPLDKSFSFDPVYRFRYRSGGQRLDDVDGPRPVVAAIYAISEEQPNEP